MSILSSRLAPGFVRLRYTGVTQPHTQIIPIKFSSTPTPGVEPQLQTTAGTPIDFTDGVNEFVASAMAEQFNADTHFGFADIYSVDPDTGIRTFIYTMNAADTGDNIGENIALVEGVFVFKTTVGKPLKVYVMEGVYDPDVRNVGTVPADGRQDMLDYILGPTNIFYGRTDAWPLAFNTFTTKVNDVLRRRSGFTDV